MAFLQTSWSFPFFYETCFYNFELLEGTISIYKGIILFLFPILICDFVVKSGIPRINFFKFLGTGKSFSNALKIVRGITMKTTSAEHGQNMFCACSFHGNSINNLLSYCGLLDATISPSEKDYIYLNFRAHCFFKKFVQKEHHAKFSVLPPEAMTR